MAYLDQLKSFMREGGLGVLEHDGWYPRLFRERSDVRQQCIELLDQRQFNSGIWYRARRVVACHA